jgi:hypothetical protein
MHKHAAIAQARRLAGKNRSNYYVVKDGLAADDQWEVATESDLDTYHLGASCVIEVDDEGQVPE